MAGLGIMIYLIARSAPRVGDDIAHDIGGRISKLDHIFSHAQFEKLDAIFNNLVEKGLRKLKLLLMKLDNLTNKYLDRVKSYKNNNGKNGIEKPNLFEKEKEEGNEKE